MIIVIEVPFVLALVHTIVGIMSKPQTPKGTKLASVHEEMLRDMNKVFASQPLDPKGGNLDPP
jgi:hypothetical protein